MYSVKLDINPLIYEHIMFFLRNLPKNMITVHTNKELKTKIDIDNLPSSVDKYMGIVNKINVNQKSSSEKLQQIKILERLATLDRLVAQSNNKVMVTRDIAIDTDGMSDDISRY